MLTKCGARPAWCTEGFQRADKAKEEEKEEEKEDGGQEGNEGEKDVALEKWLRHKYRSRIWRKK